MTQRDQAPRNFQTTRWSLVIAATEDESREALESLCRAYWFPLFAYVRRRGYAEEDAKDLTQGFFARLLERDDLSTLNPDKGRLRSFLLVSMRHYLADQADRRDALKRRAFRDAVPLDEAFAQRPRFQASEELSPEVVFERQWARRVLERALERLRRSASSEIEGERLQALEVYLTGDRAAPPQEVTAQRLGISIGAVRTAVHRLRHRFGRSLREEIADTVADPEDVDDELRHLLDLFG